MTKEDASRIQSAANRDPDSNTAQSGFAERAQSAADCANDDDYHPAGSEAKPWPRLVRGVR